jgi:hypothetical protein
MEIWKDVCNYEGDYQVSSFGRVKSLWFNKETILKPHRNIHGYLYINLRKDNKTKFRRVHRLVAEAFLPNPENKTDVDHIDRVRDNNTLDNLRWATRSENLINTVARSSTHEKNIHMTPNNTYSVRIYRNNQLVFPQKNFKTLPEAIAYREECLTSFRNSQDTFLDS